MNGRAPLFATLLVVAAVAGAGASAGSPAEPGQVERPATGPGVEAAAGVTGATLEREAVLDRFWDAFRDANETGEPAALLDRTLDRQAARLATLEARLDALAADRSAGRIDEATYRTRVSPVVARASVVRAVLDATRDAMRVVDPGALDDATVTSRRVGRLENRTAALTAEPARVREPAVDRQFYRDVASLARRYNANRSNYDLGVLGAHLDGERVAVRIVDEDGVDVVSFRTTDDGRVRDLRAGWHRETTVVVTVERATADRIVRADAPGEAASAAFLAGDLRVRGRGLFASVKWGLVSGVLWVVRTGAGVVDWLVGLVS